MSLDSQFLRKSRIENREQAIENQEQAIENRVEDRVSQDRKQKIHQRAKKVVSDSPGLVDYAIGLVNSVLNLPDGQEKFFWEVKLQKYCKTKYFKFLINSCRLKVAPTKWNLHKQDEVSHYMSDETYWDPGPARKGKADIEKTLEVNVAVTNSYWFRESCLCKFCFIVICEEPKGFDPELLWGIYYGFSKYWSVVTKTWNDLKPPKTT